MVAFPVQLMDLVPGPKYSTIALVPPETVSSSATFKIISLGAVHPSNLPVSFTPTLFG